jgi:PAS domain S-box-containing protein
MIRDSRPWRVVVVDDSSTDLADAKAALLRGSTRRYTFLEGTTAADAVRLCATEPRPDCAVLDFNLPDGTALDVLAALPSAGDGLPALPIVILTGSALLNESRAVVRAGAQDFVGKDWLTPESLTRAVENAVERHAMARELRASEANARAIYEQAAAGIVTCGRDGGFLKANPAFCAMLGYSWEELRRLNVLDLTHPDDRAADLAQVRRVLAGEIATYSLDKRFLRKDGGVVWAHLGSAPVRDAAGQIEYAVGVVVDISERKTADDELRRKELEFRTLADNTPDILTRFDHELRHTFINAAVHRATGRPASDFLGRTNRELGMPSHLCDPWEAALRRVLATGRSETIEFEFESPGGTRLFSGRLVPEYGADGGVESVLGVTSDVTDRRRIERDREQLLTAERAARSEIERVAKIKDEFLATLSHELRTPLNAIVSWAQLLQRSSDPNLVREGINVIFRNAQMQSELISDLLDMNRIVSGKLKMEVGPVDPSRVAAAAVDTVRPMAEAKRVGLTLRLTPDLPRVLGDAGRLQQVLWNLLTNAVKFTPEGGQVTVTTDTADGAVRFAVEDTGQGLDPAFVPHLFDRFSQADASAARKHGGLGLGLSIVKQLVEMHGGTVVAESAGPGAGARFTVSLPAPEARAPGAPSPSDRPAPASSPHSIPQYSIPQYSIERAGAGQGLDVNLAGTRVLLVDDQLDSLEAARRLLVESGADVATATSARAALDHLRRQRPHVLISDIGMPEMDGYELIREIRQGLGLSPEELPAAAFTAFARPEDRARALAAGYQAHIGKPLLPQNLLATVASLAKVPVS